MSVNGPYIYDLVTVENVPKRCPRCGLYQGKGVTSTHNCTASHPWRDIVMRDGEYNKPSQADIEWAERAADEIFKTHCYDCLTPYPFPLDTVLPDDLWTRISPTGDEGGLLCANCIVARLARLEPAPIVVKMTPVWVEEYE